ncbi:MAG: Spy/CpxP family protein refolding chaperone [Magnetococcales bacterium]|nr:Spy/CpxP family protein refolding chaperone [Magnetococcales bacterium]
MNTMMTSKWLTAAAALALMVWISSFTNAVAEEQTKTPEQSMGHGTPSGPAGGPGMGPGMMGGPGMGPGMMGGPGMGPGMMGGPGMGPGMMGGPGMGPGMMGSHPHGMGPGLPQHPEVLKNCLAVAKQQLAITPAQEAVWAAYAKTLIDQNDAKAALFNNMQNQVNQNSMEMETHHIEAMEQMIGQKKAVLQAYKALYAQLDDHQKGGIGPVQMAVCRH